MLMQLSDKNYKNLDDFEKVQKILLRSKDRQKFYELLLKMVGVCIKKELRLVFENPWAMQHYLKPSKDAEKTQLSLFQVCKTEFT